MFDNLSTSSSCRQSPAPPDSALATEQLSAIIMGLGEWGQRWARSNLSRAELDPRLLMWDMQRNIETEAPPAHRVVVRFRFTDPPPGSPA